MVDCSVQHALSLSVQLLLRMNKHAEWFFCMTGTKHQILILALHVTLSLQRCDILAAGPCKHALPWQIAIHT